ncbi:MAG TPA: hypothetical protein VFQ68_37045 [Streptosporangiaceae bacterium]|nr:hypothetical protein [Streptosporangiaceae bacterium]
MAGVPAVPGLSPPERTPVLMIPDAVLPVPASLMTLLTVFWPLFTAPSFRTFTGLACGFLAQGGKRTVCGMLPGAGLSRLWPVEVAVDDTLFKRRGKKVWEASWFHDGPAPGPAKTGYGNSWVVPGIVARLRFMSRPVAVPVVAKLVIKGSNSRSRLWLARRMAGRLAAALPGRQVRVVADSAYAGGEIKGLPARISPVVLRVRLPPGHRRHRPRQAPAAASASPSSPPAAPPRRDRQSRGTSRDGPSRWSLRNWQKGRCGPSGEVGST